MNDFSPNERDQERLPSVLAELPRARPQRPSRRRAAAREAANATATDGTAPKQRTTARQTALDGPSASKRTTRPTSSKQAASKQRTTAKPKASKTTARKAPNRKKASQPVEEPVPRQGYEAESELGGSTPVVPPSTAELVGSIAELAGDLAQTGISAGGRLLKGALSRLSGP